MRRIVLNGEKAEVRAQTVAELLREIGIPADRPGVAVAVNEEVVPRSRWEERRLNDGDCVEVIRPVQGGL